MEIISKYEPDETNVKEKQLSKVTPVGCKMVVKAIIVVVVILMLLLSAILMVFSWESL